MTKQAELSAFKRIRQDIQHEFTMKKFLCCLCAITGFVIALSLIYSDNTLLLVKGLRIWIDCIISWLNTFMTLGFFLSLFCCFTWSFIHKQIEKRTVTKKTCTTFPHPKTIPNENRSDALIIKRVEVGDYNPLGPTPEEIHQSWEETREICFTSLNNATYCLKSYGQKIGEKIVVSKQKINELGEKLRILEGKISEEKISGIRDGTGQEAGLSPVAGTSEQAKVGAGLQTYPVKYNILEKVLQMDQALGVKAINLQKLEKREYKNGVLMQNWLKHHSEFSNSSFIQEG